MWKALFSTKNIRNVFDGGKVKVKLPHDDKNSVVLVPNQKTTLIDGRLVVSKIDDYNVYIVGKRVILF